MLSWCDAVITQSDALFCYEIGNPGYRTGDWIRVSYTRSHRISAITPAQAPDYAKKEGTN